MSGRKRGKLMYAISDEDVEDSSLNNPINLLDTVNRVVRVEQPKILVTVKQEREDTAASSRVYFVQRGDRLVPAKSEPKQDVLVPVKSEGNITMVNSICGSFGQERISPKQDVSIPVKSEGNIFEVNSICGSIGLERMSPKQAGMIRVKSEGNITKVNSTCGSIGQESFRPKQDVSIPVKSEGCITKVNSICGSISQESFRPKQDVSIPVKSEGSVFNVYSAAGITENVSAPAYPRSCFGQRAVVIKSDLPVDQTFDSRRGDFQLICDICGARFKFPDTLERHRSAHTGEKRYFCEVCGEGFDQPAHWMKHLVNHSRNPKEEGAKRKHKCETCGKGFVMKGFLERHRIKVHNDTTLKSPMILQDGSVIPVSPGIAENSGEPEEKRVEDLKPYSCNICGKTFEVQKGLTIHLRLHVGVKAYKCLTCDKSFMAEESLTGHMKTKHGVEPPVKGFPCNVCDKRLNSLKQKIRHESFYHSVVVKRFKCETCGMRFRWRSGLVLHMGRHADDRPDKCEVCGKSFPPYYLQRHMAIHLGLKPHLCHVCGKGFSRKGHMVEHLKFHSKERPHVCQVCGKGFAVKKLLSKHMSVHSNDRPYSCDICASRFKRKTCMDRHKKKYHSSSGIKPRRKFVRKDVLYCVKEKTSKNDQHIIKEASSS